MHVCDAVVLACCVKDVHVCVAVVLACCVKDVLNSTVTCAMRAAVSSVNLKPTALYAVCSLSALSLVHSK